jgi:hypothetical protein
LPNQRALTRQVEVACNVCDRLALVQNQHRELENDDVSYGLSMITIAITNVQDIVEKQKGWFVANVVGAFVDLEQKVEDIVIEKLRAALAAEGVEAVIERRPA